MNILEHEIEDLIWNTIQDEDFEQLQKRGLPIIDWFDYRRQLNLGRYGIADLVGFGAKQSKTENGNKTRTIYIDVFELKRGNVDASCFFQAIRYAKGFQRLAVQEGLSYEFVFRTILVGKSIDLSHELPYLPDIVNNVILLRYNLSMEHGLVFTPIQNYSLKREEFPSGLSLKNILLENVLRNVSDFREGVEIRKFIESGRTNEITEDLPF